MLPPVPFLVFGFANISQIRVARQTPSSASGISHHCRTHRDHAPLNWCEEMLTATLTLSGKSAFSKAARMPNGYRTDDLPGDKSSA